jgi:hypothetical protein
VYALLALAGLGVRIEADAADAARASGRRIDLVSAADRAERLLATATGAADRVVAPAAAGSALSMSQTLDHFWLDVPAQSQSWSCAPLAVLLSCTSTHRLAATFTRSPAAENVNC